MKHLLLLMAGAFLSSCSATFIPNEIENGKLLGVMPMQYGRASYQVTHKLTASREDVFRQVRKWASFHTANPTTAFAITDNQLGDVIAPGIFDAETANSKRGTVAIPIVTYAASVECEDNHYRVTFTNFRFSYLNTTFGVESRPSGTTKKRARQQLEQIDRKVSRLLENIQTFVAAEVK